MLNRIKQAAISKTVMILLTGIAIAIFFGSQAQAKKVYCDVAISFKFTVEGSMTMRDFDRICRENARSEGYDYIPVGPDKVCTLCKKGSIREADSNPGTSSPAANIPGFGPDIRLMSESGEARSCSGNTKPPYWVSILAAGSLPNNCPPPWITGGKNRNTNPVSRYCAYCGPGYQSRLNRFRCCVPK